jgi:hypothetical protein
MYFLITFWNVKHQWAANIAYCIGGATFGYSKKNESEVWLWKVEVGMKGRGKKSVLPPNKQYK